MDDSILRDLRSELLTRRALEDLPEGVWKRTAALNTWGTNALEGNTLTWADVERLLLEERGVADRPVSDIVETLQHERAFRSLRARKKSPLSLVVVLELHESVFKDLQGKDAGQWRRVNVRIRGTVHRPPSMEHVVAQMEQWLGEYDRRDLGGEETFALATWMHHRFESIHPFTDGNGRVGRLLLNLHFLKRNWPPIHLGPADRRVYLASLEAGHTGDLSPLEQLMRRAMAASLLDLLDQVGTKQDSLKPLGTFPKQAGYSAHYLALRAHQGALPALKQGGRWNTSARAVDLYTRHIGRS